MARCTPKEVRRAARRAVTIFRQHGMSSCLFGSLACHIWGMTYRDPKDVDLIVLDNGWNNTEDLKNLLVAADDNFYLVPARDPDATYQVLHYMVGAGRSCKVDILTTGDSTSLDLPPVPIEEVIYVHPFTDLPVMPVLPLLLMKLQGWVDHLHSPKPHERAKVRQDVADIRVMLDIANGEQVHVNDQEFDWMPYDFVGQMRTRVDQYIRRFPESQQDWENLGM
ncbi:hypothetical protein F5878DRAFT_79338 [Lentinula raphanica]|uniref:Nucleotidyltransferase n=1 Tax=Lentinula raphanica TaxID=153919 RepID=A0AA38UGH0_9AGAR|nr:hypothetical protein F5878DRAFT_79338 [Lentinula raphanica]